MVIGNDSLTDAGAYLYGGTGDDTMTGGAGVDTMTGDTGTDTFVVSDVALTANAAVITDFSETDDLIRS